MWTLVLTAVAVAATAEAGLLYASAPQDRGQFYRSSAGSYNYGYNTGDGTAKVEVKRKDGSVVGSYRYFDPNGKQIVRSYVADSRGFRVLGNDLPIAPETPAAAIIGAPALTASVEGAAQEVVDLAQHPTKRQNTIDLRDLQTQPLLLHYQQQQTVFQQQADLLLQQQKIIQQQQRQLDALTGAATISSPTKVNLSTRDDTSSNTVPVNSVQFNTIESNVSPNDASYFYYPHNYNYDFPAGFAYPGGVVEVVEVPEPEVIGVRGTESERNIITAGHRHPTLSVPDSPVVVIGKTRLLYRRPFVIGRM